MTNFYTLILWTMFYTAKTDRSKRFLLDSTPRSGFVPFVAPTPYAVPSLPNGKQGQTQFVTSRPFLTGSSLLNSARVQCPLKRDVDFQRVLLDDRLMLELFLALNKDADLSKLLSKQMKVTYDIAIMNGQESPNENKLSIIHRKMLGNNITQNSSDTSSSTPNRRNIFEEILNIFKSGNTHLENFENKLKDDIQQNWQSQRTKRDTIGAVSSNVEYCTRRGTATGTGYIHMCTSCALTTQFPEDTFPRYTNEITCDQSDCDCFVVHQTAHGQCQPVIQYIKMLKRKADGCRLVIKNGQQLIVDDWELYDQPLHVGCECVFNKNSLFATFIPGK